MYIHVFILQTAWFADKKPCSFTKKMTKITLIHISFFILRELPKLAVNFQKIDLR